LKTHPYSFSKFWVIYFHAPHISSSTSPHEDVSAKQLFTEINFSRIDKDTVAVILLGHSCYKGLNFVSLLFTAVTKANYVDCNAIFLELFGKDFQSVDVLSNCGGHETYYSLFLCVVGSMLQS
jgi:hypothetical protein